MVRIWGDGIILPWPWPKFLPQPQAAVSGATPTSAWLGSGARDAAADRIVLSDEQW